MMVLFAHLEKLKMGQKWRDLQAFPSFVEVFGVRVFWNMLSLISKMLINVYLPFIPKTTS